MGALNIEQKMEYLRKALEMGADIDVKFYNVGNKKDALQTAKELSDFINIPYEQRSREDTNWLRIDSKDWSLRTTVYYENHEGAIA